MDFGRLDNIEQVDFSFPPDHPGVKKILNGTRSDKLSVYVGAPVWTHEEFIGKIYPANAKAKDFVKYYGGQFNSVELNATLYRVPEPKTIKAWANVVPEGFKFCPKLHQSISHTKEDISKSIGALHEFHNVVQHFGDKLGTCFLQLPPWFSSSSVSSLTEFLDNCPVNDLAVELRNESWFSESTRLSELCNYLYKNNYSLVITDVAGRRDVLHQRLTNKTAFIRYTANNLHPTDFKRLDDWVKRATEWINSGLENLYFFVHTKNKGLTPELAIYFIEKLNAACGLDIKPPHILSEKKSELF